VLVGVIYLIMNSSSQNTTPIYTSTRPPASYTQAPASYTQPPASSQNTTPIYTSTQPPASSTPALTREFFGPNPNIFGDNDCPNLGNLSNQTLDSCKQQCRNTAGCTAFNFKSSNSTCTLRGCSTGKEPSKDAYGVAGYSNYKTNFDLVRENDNSVISRRVQYYGPNDKYWSDNDCPNLLNFTDSLENCKDMCNLTDGCTVINYVPSNSSCTLRKCTQGTIPSAQSADIKGYSKYQINTNT